MLVQPSTRARLLNTAVNHVVAAAAGVNVYELLEVKRRAMALLD